MKSLQKILTAIGRPVFFLIIYSVIAFSIAIELIKKYLRKPPLPNLAFLKFTFPKLPTLKFPSLTLQKPIIHIPKFKYYPHKKVIYIILTILITSSFIWLTLLRNLPSPNELSTRNIEVSTKIYDRNGHLLYKIYKDQNRSLVSLKEVPLHVQLATLAAEDAEFFSHPGFSVRGIIRSILKYTKEGKVQGGSTITQQLVKNALLSPERTIPRKIKELILAVLVEQRYSKEEILEMYLNEVPYGGTTYGIEEASQYYFKKSVKNISLAEAALLAGLPKSPTRLSPFSHNPEKAIQRQKEVINLMQINGFITKNLAEKAKNEKLKFAKNQTPIRAPHFVMYIRETLVNKYGEELVNQGGLEVTTTLDLKIQTLAEEAVKSEIEKIQHLNVKNGAALVLNTQTGEILAMVGSKDYFDIENDGNVNVLLRLRQPGSSIKVINYAHALSNGYTPASILSDIPTTFYVRGAPPYTPKNYDGKFRGNITLRSALAESRNIPAVRVLNSYGVAKMLDLGKKMGITTWANSDQYGLALTLGGGDVRLIDLSRVYATIANYGMRPEIISIQKITNHKGDTLFEQKAAKKEHVLDPRVAFMLTDILSDNLARSPAFGIHSTLSIPNHPEIAVKTGTSNNLKDNITIGYNQNYLVSTWVGNNDSSPMARVASGITGASPIWNKIMSTLVAQSPNHPWKVPDGLVQIPICSLTGTLPCKNCPTRLEWFLVENKPAVHCNPEYISLPPKLLPSSASTERLNP